MATRASDAESKTLAAVIQLTCTSDKAANLKRATTLIEEAAKRGASVAFLPEAFDYIGENRQQVIELAEPLDAGGGTLDAYRRLAEKHKIALSLGGMHEAATGSEDKIRNTHILLGTSYLYRQKRKYCSILGL